MTAHNNLHILVLVLLVAVGCLTHCNGATNTYFQMGVVYSYPDSKCTSGTGKPYVLDGLALDIVPNGVALQMFPKNLCAAFTVSPALQTIRLTDCTSRQGFTVLDEFCLGQVQVNRCGDEEVVPGAPWYEMRCQSDFQRGDVVELNFGCQGPIGNIPVFLRANQCTSQDNALASDDKAFRLTCTPATAAATTFKPGYEFFEGQLQCAGTPSSKQAFTPNKCIDVSTVVPPELGTIDTDRGVRASCYGGPIVPSRVSFGVAETTANVAVGVGIALTAVPVIGAALAGGAAGGGAPGTGDAFAVLSMAQFLSTITMMELPHAPEEILNFGSSLSWTMGVVPIVGTNENGSFQLLPNWNQDSATRRRRLQSGDVNRTIVAMSGPEAYCARVGVEPRMMFLSVLLMFLILQMVAALAVVFYGFFHKSEDESQLILYYVGLANPILYACFFPLFLASCYQLYLLIVEDIPFDAESIVLTVMAGFVIFFLAFWVTFLALRIRR
jgi:hypothetical protein